MCSHKHVDLQPAVCEDQRVCAGTGIVLDPESTAKALWAFSLDVQSNPEAWEGRTVVFLYTGMLSLRPCPGLHSWQAERAL